MDTPDSKYQKLDTQEGDIKLDIPDHKLAKLMYYLECIFTILESDTEKRYTNYKNYYLLSKLEEQTVLGLVSTFNPTLMKDLNLIKIEPDFVPIGKEHEFFDISDEIFEGKINSEVVIAEVNRKVLKVMVCKQSWIDKYYEEPLKEYENPPEEEKEEKKEKKDSYYPLGLRYRQQECTCCGCTCDCCCNYDCDEPFERNCICCRSGRCTCRRFSDTLAIIFWTLVFGSCCISSILGCVGVFSC